MKLKHSLLFILLLVQIPQPLSGKARQQEPTWKNFPTKKLDWSRSTGKNRENPARKISRERLLNQVESKWLPPEIRGNEDRAIDVLLQETPVEKKLRQIILPKICFINTPLRDAVEMLNDLSVELDPAGLGVNMVLLDQPVDGTNVFLTLRESSLEKILDYMTQSVGYEYDTEGDTVLLSCSEKDKKRLLTKVFPISRAAVVRLTNLREMGSSADPQQRTEREECLLRSFFERSGLAFDIQGSNIAFDGSNLIVTQTRKNLQRVEKLLKNYQKIQQVEIEIKFLEVQQSALNEWQFKLLGTHKERSTFGSSSQKGSSVRSLEEAFSTQSFTNGDGQIVINPGSSSQKQVYNYPNRPPMMPNRAQLGENSTPLLDLLGVINHVNVNTVLRALEQQAGSDLMSAPKITVLSGKTAQIVVAQEFRYPQEYGETHSSGGVGVSENNIIYSGGVTITAGTPRNFTVRNVGVEMSVTPIVEAENRISLQLEPSVTEFEGFVEYGGSNVAIANGSTVMVPSGFFQPIFSTRRIQTEVTIENGATVVMGGLTREEIKEVRDRVPVLGKLPLVGHFFRSHGITSQKRNLLIFVTAKLIDLQGGDYLEGEIVHVQQPIRSKSATIPQHGGPITRH